MSNESRPTPPQYDGGRLELSQQDHESLIQVERKQQVLRDRVTGVVRGLHTGAVITGRGGTFKSFTVTGQLEELGVPHVPHNSHITSRGLIDELALNPSAVHVFEDVEELLRNQVSLGVLRSATWGVRRNREGRIERIIKWGAYGAHLEVYFDGGIILISNRRLSQLPELQALVTRIPCIDLPVSDQEIAALMRSVALKGYHIGDAMLAAAECLEVADFLIRESEGLRRPLDMRLLINAFADRILAEDHESGCGWQDLVASTLHGRPSVVENIEPVGIRRQKKARELEVARQIVQLPRQERLRLWKERTEASESTLYRRLAELGRVDALDFGM
jgi:hypothetical protein